MGPGPLYLVALGRWQWWCQPGCHTEDRLGCSGQRLMGGRRYQLLLPDAAGVVCPAARGAAVWWAAGSAAGGERLGAGWGWVRV
jgi:hypothetical protein